MGQQVAERGSMWGGGGGDGLGRAQRRRTGGRGRGSLSTTDLGAGADCNCRSWCEEGPRARAEALGKTISWNRPPREDRAPI